jgi:hypothetical protein
MEAPPGRYRVIEKDGRLVVVETETGAPAPSVVPRTALPRPSSPPMVAGKGLLDSLADALAARVAKGRDPEGRIVIAWEWKQNGKTRRWDAALDAGQQRRLGRALLAIVAAFPAVLITFVTETPFIALFVAVPLIVWAMIAINRLQAETRDGARPG